MDNWLKRYKILGAVVFGCLACLLLFYMLVIRPSIQDAIDMRKDLTSKEKRLSKSKWPMQKESLEKILSEEIVPGSSVSIGYGSGEVVFS